VAELREGRARASDALPLRPYVYRGQPELSALAVGGNGWDPPGERELAEHVRMPPAPRCWSCDYLVTAPGHAIECGGPASPMTDPAAGRRTGDDLERP
jgi:hypothetical protein